MARPGLALTAEQRLFLADTPSARDPHQMADRVERLQDVGGGELLTTTEEAA